MRFYLSDARGRQHRVEWHLVPALGESAGRVLAVGLDVTRLRDSERRLSWLRSHDEVTGLFNRRAFEQYVAQMPGTRTLMLIRPARANVLSEILSEASREGLQRELAERMRRLASLCGPGEPALLDRLTFAIVLNVGQAELEKALPERIARLDPRYLAADGQTIDLDLRVLGIELPNDIQRRPMGDSLEALERLSGLQNDPLVWLTADALRQQEQDEYHHWVREIDTAIQDDRVVLFYQPIYDTQTLQPMHSEVLIRMLAPDGTVITPASFLRTAERSGQLRQLDRIVFAKTIDALLALRKDGLRHHLAINVAAPSLQEPYLLRLIERAIQERGLDPEHLMLEVVESQAIGSLDTAVKLMQRFRELGVKILLDDFGIGFTSFEYLRELPFQYVKIDQLFVRNLAQRPDDQRLIGQIHDMVRGLGRQTIAEGVEDAASLRILQKIGVDAVQGFGLARPARQVNLARGEVTQPPHRVEMKLVRSS